MKQCQWSQTNLCQVFLLKGSLTKVTCDGLKDRSCSKNLDIEDIRHRKPDHCPDPLCLPDLPGALRCNPSPKEAKPRSRWGGKRAGAGAPPFNLNRLTHAQRSRVVRRAIARMAQDPELRALLYIIARLADEGTVPVRTKRMIQFALAQRYHGVNDG